MNHPELSSMTSQKHEAQAFLDLVSLHTFIITGFTAHPYFNDIAMTNGDPKQFLQAFVRQLEEIALVMDIYIKANEVLSFPLRYSDKEMRSFLESFGHELASHVNNYGTPLTKDESIVLFEKMFKEYFRK